MLEKTDDHIVYVKLSEIILPLKVMYKCRTMLDSVSDFTTKHKRRDLIQ